MLRLDPVTKRNIDLIQRYSNGIPASDLEWKYNPASKLYILGEIARFRLWSQSDIALDKLESWVKKNDIDMFEWPHGQTARALLYLDKGMIASAVNIVEKTMKLHPRHPHLRRLAIHLASQDEMKMPESEVTGLVWADTMDGNWEHNWVKSHNVVAAPSITTNTMKSHSWYANSWVVRKDMNPVCSRKKDWKKVSWSTPPVANQLIMSGLITTVGGIPVDLGFPGWINIKACEKAKLFDL
jgi:hypothetical protein